MCSWLSEILRGLFSNLILKKPLNISVKEPRWGVRKIPGLTRKGSWNCVILLSFLPLISSTHYNLISGIVLNILPKILWWKSRMTPILLIQGIFVTLCLKHSTTWDSGHTLLHGLQTSPGLSPPSPSIAGGHSASWPGNVRCPQGQAEPSALLPPRSVLQAVLLPLLVYLFFLSVSILLIKITCWAMKMYQCLGHTDRNSDLLGLHWDFSWWGVGVVFSFNIFLKLPVELKSRRSWECLT